VVVDWTDAEKRNDLPVWEVDEHTRQVAPGVLLNKYYEGAEAGAHGS
jgi:hypothetical protein